MFLGLAIGLAIFSIIAGSAKKKGVSLTLGILAMLSFITWLDMIGVISWMDNPTVNIPDNVPIPGQ